jgi:hypothetical protein
MIEYLKIDEAGDGVRNVRTKISAGRASSHEVVYSARTHGRGYARQVVADVSRR